MASTRNVESSTPYEIDYIGFSQSFEFQTPLRKFPLIEEANPCPSMLELIDYSVYSPSDTLLSLFCHPVPPFLHPSPGTHVSFR